MKPAFYSVFIFLAFSLKNWNLFAYNHAEKPALGIPHADFIPDSLVQNLIHHPEKINVHRFMILVDASLTEIDQRHYDFQMKSFYIDFDEDPDKEIIVYCTNRPDLEFEYHIYIFNYNAYWKRYSLCGTLRDDGMDESMEPMLDQEHQLIMRSSTIWGTCDRGNETSIYKMVNAHLQYVGSFPGTHEINSCGTYDDPCENAEGDCEYFSEITANHRFLSADTIEVNISLSDGIIRFFEGKSEKISYNRKQMPVRLYYIFDKKRQFYESFDHAYRKVELSMNLASEVSTHVDKTK